MLWAERVRCRVERLATQPTWSGMDTTLQRLTVRGPSGLFKLSLTSVRSRNRLTQDLCCVFSAHIYQLLDRFFHLHESHLHK